MSKQQTFPTDIHSLNKLGIDRLGDMQWPVSDEEHFSLVRGYRDAFEDVLLEIRSEHQGVLIADFAFIGFLAQASHARAVFVRATKAGVSMEIGPLAQAFYNPNWELLANIEPHDAQGSPLAFRLKGLAKDLKFNSHLGLITRITGDSRRALGIGSFTRLKGEYARKYGLYVRNTYLRNLLPYERKNNDAPKALASAAEEIFTRISWIFADKFGFPLNLADAELCWKQRLGRLHKVFEALAARRDLPREVLVSETARPFHKAVAAGFRTAGGRAVGFHHGNSMGGRYSDMTCYNELAAYNTFVCPTHACAVAFAEDYMACPVSQQLSLDVVASETSYYKRLHQNMAGKSIPKHIKTVMLMGFPMNANRYYGMPGNFFLFQLDLEIRLTRVLKQNGYRVLYKIHPERQSGAREVMEPLCDEIVSNPFEHCWERADAILIKYTASSTFGFALCTNRPIVLLDHERSSWRPDHYEALTRRCRIVPAWIQKSRIVFDEDALIEALRKKSQPPDNTYVHNFMFPCM